MPGVWERGEDGTLTVRDACFETLRNRLRNHFLVTHVRVYPPEEGKPAAEAPLIKRLSVKRKKIDCYLRAGKLSQKLSIFVEPPFEHVVVSSIGVDLEWKPLSDL